MVHFKWEHFCTPCPSPTIFRSVSHKRTILNPPMHSFPFYKRGYSSFCWRELNESLPPLPHRPTTLRMVSFGMSNIFFFALGREQLPKQLFDCWRGGGGGGNNNSQRPPNLPTIAWAATLDPGHHSFSKWTMQGPCVEQQVFFFL